MKYFPMVATVLAASMFFSPAYAAPEDIRCTQERLNQLGYNTGYIDGVTGANTQAATDAFSARLAEAGLDWGLEPFTSQTAANWCERLNAVTPYTAWLLAKTYTPLPEDLEFTISEGDNARFIGLWIGGWNNYSPSGTLAILSVDEENWANLVYSWAYTNSDDSGFFDVGGLVSGNRLDLVEFVNGAVVYFVMLSDGSLAGSYTIDGITYEGLFFQLK